jgi:hypothetical protein
MGGFDLETKILTNVGWKTFEELNEDSLLITFNKESSLLEYQKYFSKCEIQYEGDVYRIETKHCDLLIHPEQLLYHCKLVENNWKDEKICNFHLGKNRIIFKSAGTFNHPEYDIEDNMIKLIAWLITDGGIKRIGNYKSILFYQRKEKVHLITEILDSLNITYRYKERIRNITNICGKELKNKIKIQCELSIKSEESKKLFKWIDDKYTLPDWVYKLSDRQFKIFLSSMVDGDGSRHKSCPESSWMLYGVYKVVEQLQIATFLHNIRTTISTYREKDKRLNISLNSNSIHIDGFGKCVSEGIYSGKLWNVTTPNKTIVIKRNEKILIVPCDV